VYINQFRWPNGFKKNATGQFHYRIGHEVPEGECTYSATLSSSSALEVGGCSTPRTGCFTFGKKLDTHCTEGWLEPRVVLDGCGKSRPNRDSIPGRPIHSLEWAYPSFYGSCLQTSSVCLCIYTHRRCIYIFVVFNLLECLQLCCTRIS